MAKLTEAKITKRFNTGEYEFEEYTLSAEPDAKESGVKVLTALKKDILEAFVGEESTSDKKTEKKEKKNAKSRSSGSDNDDEETESEEAEESDGDGAENDEAADAEDSDDSDGESENDGAEEDDEKESSAKSKKEKGAKGKGGKKYVKKPQAYNRSIEQHKEIFSGVLRSVSPDWKKSDATKAKAKKASENLEGEPFLDENGDVLESFKSAVKKMMAGKK